MPLPSPLVFRGQSFMAFICQFTRVAVSKFRSWNFLEKFGRDPLLCAVPFAVCLFAAKWAFPTKPLLALTVGGLLAGMALATCYWIWVLPPAWKQKVWKTLGLGRFAKTSFAEPAKAVHSTPVSTSLIAEQAGVGEKG